MNTLSHRLNRPIFRGVSIALCLLLGASASPGIAESQKPNVILIMADDLGYNDLSCYGSKVIRTPVLDKLASEGIRLTGFYTGATVCTPSRMALMTGAYPPRVGWQGGVELVASDDPASLADRCTELYLQEELWSSVRERALDINQCQALMKIDRSGKCLDKSVGGFVEATAPHAGIFITHNIRIRLN